LCRQPCRRIYSKDNNEKYLFNLKDNQQIELVSEFKKMGISSLKIEGRMKSAEYVYNTAKAYRMALDNEEKAKIMEAISKDLAREKTGYFMSGNVAGSITDKPYTGKHIGDVHQRSAKMFKFYSKYEPVKGNRLRVLPKSGRDTAAFKLKENFSYESSGDGYLITINQENNFEVSDKIFLIGFGDLKFKSKFTLDAKKINLRMPKGKSQNILNKIGSSKTSNKEQIYVRIDSIKWMMKLYLPKVDAVILRFNREDWQKFNPETGFIQKNINKLIIELPKFISETDIEFYRDLCSKMYRSGIKQFMLSHISQKLILPKKMDLRISTNENVYTLNDAAIQMLKEENIGLYLYPQEDDFPNLLAGKDRQGIMPLYFYPELFYSRMPVDIANDEEFKDKTDSFRKTVVDGITVVLPNRPVSF
ncbi:MAG: U32 family peptidase, partial [Candidatus Cloacimonetes bacterium]|nr:U32 family peptidase [Candidatus Cloacimonadota bacterium]